MCTLFKVNNIERRINIHDQLRISKGDTILQAKNASELRNAIMSIVSSIVVDIPNVEKVARPLARTNTRPK